MSDIINPDTGHELQSQGLSALKTLLITGIAGFIGSNLAKKALERGYQVRGLDDFSSGKPNNIHPFRQQITFVPSSLLDLEAVRYACEGADLVLHHAAIASVPKSLDDPLGNHAANTTGTLNLLVAARDTGVRRIIFASSSSVYGDQGKLPITEDSPFNPLSPYAASKAAGELYMQVFGNSFGLETVRFRYFNVFGPNQDPSSPYSGVLARFIQQMLNGEQPTIFGDGEQTRDFTYVDNVVEANLLACEARAERVNGRCFNVAMGREVSLNSIYRVLQDATGYDRDPAYAEARKGDIRHSLADISRLQSALGYQALVSLEEGLLRTVEWYRRETSCAPAQK